LNNYKKRLGRIFKFIDRIQKERVDVNKDKEELSVVKQKLQEKCMEIADLRTQVGYINNLA